MQRTTSFFRRTGWFAILALFAVISGGCGTGDLPVIQVTGKVLFEGEPVDGAMVTLIPTASGGREASGITDVSGECLLLTPGAAKSGCLPGSYRVVISKHIDVDERGNPVVYSDEPTPAYASAAASAAPQTRPISKSMLPDKYGDVETSGLTADVMTKKGQVFVFELTK